MRSLLTHGPLVQAAKETLERAIAKSQQALAAKSAELQARLAQELAGETVDQLRAFVANASAERESLKKSLQAAAKVRPYARVLACVLPTT